MKKIIEKYRKFRKLKALNRQYSGMYAFIGIGNHSLNNLYPVLDYLKVSVKYIVSQSEATAKAVSGRSNFTQGTTDLEKVLSDNEIKGIFICTSPDRHFGLVKKVLEYNKHVFVEKPPCRNSRELLELIGAENNSRGRVLAGLQKRYAPLYLKLKSLIKEGGYYNLKYITGSYPEGDPLTDLYIHPLDLCTYLFGNAEIKSLLRVDSAAGRGTLLLHTSHSRGIVGTIELSTDNWWASGKESLMYNSGETIYEAFNTQRLIRTEKPAQIMGIPLEKIFTPEIKQTILYEQNSFLPVGEHNPLVSAGYYGEIVSFLNMCENKGKNGNKSSLSSLVNTFQLLEKISNTGSDV